MIASTYNEHQEATEEQSDQGTLGKEIWSQKLAQRIQLQLEEDGGGDSRQNWMEKSDLWPRLLWERPGVSHISKISPFRFIVSM